MNTAVYNYSGTNQTLGGYVFPVGGPYLIERDILTTNNAIVINSSGTLEYQEIQPDFFAIYTDGFGFGVMCAGALLCIWIVKKLRTFVGGN